MRTYNESDKGEKDLLDRTRYAHASIPRRVSSVRVSELYILASASHPTNQQLPNLGSHLAKLEST